MRDGASSPWNSFVPESSFLPCRYSSADADAARDHQRVVRGEGEGLPLAALEDRGEGAALDELRRDVEGLLDAADPEHADEAGVLQARREAGLVHQPLRDGRLRRDARREAEHGHEPIEAGRSEPCGPILATEHADFRLLEENESAELLPQSHGPPLGGCGGR